MRYKAIIRALLILFALSEERLEEGREEGGRKMKLSELAVEKVGAYFEFFGVLGRAIGVVAGALLFIAGAFAVVAAAIALIFESARLMILLGWYFLLIPMGILAAIMPALLWLKRQGAFDEGRNSKNRCPTISTRRSPNPGDLATIRSAAHRRDPSRRR
jgi:hypothetical protein